MSKAEKRHPLVIVHADESCLGNGAEGQNPGGAASLIETRSEGGIVRRDLYISSPDTTNNRMALSGAIATFALLSRKGKRLRVLFVSDSQYLIKGMTEWIHEWRRRGWRRKGGTIENLELWRRLDEVSAPHHIAWEWVRGHDGHPRNEYVNDLAIQAARAQLMSEALEPSRFSEWLTAKQAANHFLDFDPKQTFESMAHQLARS